MPEPCSEPQDGTAARRAVTLPTTFAAAQQCGAGAIADRPYSARPTLAPITFGVFQKFLDRFDGGMLWIPAESAYLLVILTGQMRSGIGNRERIDEHDAVAQGFGYSNSNLTWQSSVGASEHVVMSS
jgi:hypothetical protein